MTGFEKYPKSTSMEKLLNYSNLSKCNLLLSTPAAACEDFCPLSLTEYNVNTHFHFTKNKTRKEQQRIEIMIPPYSYYTLKILIIGH